MATPQIPDPILGYRHELKDMKNINTSVIMNVVLEQTVDNISLTLDHLITVTDSVITLMDSKHLDTDLAVLHLLDDHLNSVYKFNLHKLAYQGFHICLDAISNQPSHVRLKYKVCRLEVTQ